MFILKSGYFKSGTNKVFHFVDVIDATEKLLENGLRAKNTAYFMSQIYLPRLPLQFLMWLMHLHDTFLQLKEDITFHKCRDKWKLLGYEWFQYLLIKPEVFIHPTIVDLFDRMLSRMVLV